MIQRLVILFFSLSVTCMSQAQRNWFTVYSDSGALVQDATAIIEDVVNQLHKVDADLELGTNQVIKHTTPYLIYMDLEKHQINLPLWAEVIPEQKVFFADVTGDSSAAIKVFGLFFNGFYLVHEYGHAFASCMGKKYDNHYDSEYDANLFAMAYWKHVQRDKDLESCYRWARKMMENLKNPVPGNADPKKYLTDHYEELSADPYKYGYIQFSQFIDIYNRQDGFNWTELIRSYKK